MLMENFGWCKKKIVNLMNLIRRIEFIFVDKIYLAFY